MKLVASLIVRDELARYQPALTKHLLSYCDEVRVLDDGSTDRTGVKLGALSDRILIIRNGRSRWDAEGEGAARQQLLDWSLAAAADFVLPIDGDEVVPDGAALRDAIERTPVDLLDAPEPVVYSLRMVEVWSRKEKKTRSGPLPFFGDNESIPRMCDLPYMAREGTWWVRVDGGWAPRDCPILWQAPPVSMPVEDAWRAGWTIPRLRLACGREPEVVRYQDPIPSGCDILHLGWSNGADRRRRYERYMRVDGGRFHASEHLRSIMEEPRLEPYPAPAVDLG